MLFWRRNGKLVGNGAKLINCPVCPCTDSGGMITTCGCASGPATVCLCATVQVYILNGEGPLTCAGTNYGNGPVCTATGCVTLTGSAGVGYTYQFPNGVVIDMKCRTGLGGGYTLGFTGGDPAPFDANTCAMFYLFWSMGGLDMGNNYLNTPAFPLVGSCLPFSWSLPRVCFNQTNYLLGGNPWTQPAIGTQVGYCGSATIASGSCS